MSVYIALAPAKIDRERIKIVFNMDCREKLLDEYIIHSNHHWIVILLALQEVTKLVWGLGNLIIWVIIYRNQLTKLKLLHPFHKRVFSIFMKLKPIINIFYHFNPWFQNTTKSEVKSNSLFKDGTKAVDNNNIMATSLVFNSMEAKIALSIMAIIIIFNLRLNNINNMFKFRLNNLGTSVRSSNTKTAIMMLILGIVTVIIMTSRNSIEEQIFKETSDL